jgi:nucleoside-diphosphate-sugar epimerase
MRSNNLNVISGSNGFIGSRLSARLRDEGSDFLACYRDNCFKFFSGESVQELENLEVWVRKRAYDKFTFYHCSTKYVRENSSLSIEELIAGNFRYPFELICLFVKLGDVHVVNLNSYLQAMNNLIGYTVSNYANSKNLLYFNLYELVDKQDITNIFLYETYGHGDSRDKLIPLINEKWRAGSPIRINSPEREINLMHVSDVIDFILLAGIEKISGVFQLSHPRLQTVRELVGLIEVECKAQKDIQISYSTNAETSKLPLQIAPIPTFWKPRIDLEEGLAGIFGLNV